MIIAFCLAVGFIFWHFLYGLELYMNGASLNEGNIRFSCFLQELRWILPGGSKLKGEYIKKSMGNFEEGSMCSEYDSWDYKEIRENNLYEKVGNAMLPGFTNFLFIHVLVPFGPLILYLTIISMIS